MNKFTCGLLEQHDGFAVWYIPAGGIRRYYIRSVYRGHYKITRDHTYAKHFTEKTARRHVAALIAEDERWTNE